MSNITFFGGEVEDVIEDTASMNQLMDMYVVGSGRYAQLRYLEQRMSDISTDLSPEALNSKEGKAFMTALNKLKALHASEADIKSAGQISMDQSTKKAEEAKKGRYEEQRAYMGITQLAPEKEFNFMPLLFIAGAGTAAYFMFKG